MAQLKDMLGGGSGDRFLDLPDASWSQIEADIVVFGADCATPYVSVGPYCAGGPAAIRAASGNYAGDLARLNFDLLAPILPPGVKAVDAGDVGVDPVTPEQNREAIKHATETVLAAGAVPVLIGGDDSVPSPMLQAFAGREPLTILQIDAHIDWRDEVQGERWGLSSTMRRASELAHVNRIVQVGARGVGSAGPADLQVARDWGAVLVPAQDLRRGGIARALAAIPEGSDIFIAFDWDALDPTIMPAVIAPTAGGLTYGDALELIQGAAKRGRIAGVAVVEFMPDGDRDEIGARTAAQMLTTTLGLIADQRAGI